MHYNVFQARYITPGTPCVFPFFLKIAKALSRFAALSNIYKLTFYALKCWITGITGLALYT